MNEPIEERLRAHYAILGQQPMPSTLQDRLIQRRPGKAAPRWAGVLIGIATAAVVFAAIAVPLVERNAGPGPASGGTSLAAIRADFVRLVNMDSSTIGALITATQSACAGSGTPGPGSTTCTNAVNRLGSELLKANGAFNAATVPGGVAAEMAQLVQALGAFASAYYSGSAQSSVVITDATAIAVDLRALQRALATG